MNQFEPSQDAVPTEPVLQEPEETTEVNAEDEETSLEETGNEHEDAGYAEQPQKKGKDFQNRINEVTREKYEYKRKYEELLNQKDSKSSYEGGNAEKPDITNFETYEEYEQAMDVWYDAKIEKRLADAKRQEQLTSIQVRFDNNVEQTRQKISDFDEVIQKGLERKIVLPLDDDFMDDPNAAAALYHISKNESLHYELATLSPTQVAIRVGKILAALEQPTKTNKTSSAPAPLKQVNPNADVAVDDSQLSDKEWFARRNKKR